LRKAPLTVGRDASRDRIDPHKVKRPNPKWGSKKNAMQKKLTNAVFEQVCQRGYAIVEGLLPAEQVAQMAVAARRLLKPWHEVKKDPPKDRLSSSYFPYPEQVLNEAIVHREAIAFAQRYLGTQAIHYRPGLLMCTYPGRGGMDFHLDNGNNSLLPPTSERRHAQLNFWFYLEDVEADQAPTLFVANEYERDPAKAEAFVAPAGSVAIFDNYSWHAASPYKRQDGQRYVWKFAYGRADHYWEGVAHYTQVASNEHFRQFISGLSARDRELFRFPPAGSPYYTREMLDALEGHYPGWNARGEYAPSESKIRAAAIPCV
jgi:hypothetical protein